MLFEVHPTPAKGKDGKNIVYVKPACARKLSLQAVEDFCNRNHYGLRDGELTMVFNVFIDAAAELMSMGYRIETPIGSFAPKLALKREITDPDKVKNDDVMLDGVDYQPGKRWQKAIGKWLYDGFRKADTPNVQQLMSNQQHLEEALEKSLQGGYATVRSFAYYAQITKYSARKQLEAWTQGANPKLLKTRMGQQFIYTMT
jgi:hypothetical protein